MNEFSHQYDIFEVNQKERIMDEVPDYVGYDLFDYQEWVSSVSIYPEHFGVLYSTTGLTAEAGEVAGKIGKVYRDKDGNFSPEDIASISDELGDVLWMLAAVANEFDIDLEDVKTNNIRKIEDRKVRGKISGSGDKR